MHDEATRRVIARTAALVAVWGVLTVAAGLLIFLNSSATTVVAGHRAEVSATLDGYATVDLGPYLPHVRYPTGQRLGAHIDLGTTPLTSYNTLLQRYASIAADPQGQVAKVRSTLGDLAKDSAITAGLAVAVVPLLWELVGRRRRSEILAYPAARLAMIVAVTILLLAGVLTRPWAAEETDVAGSRSWRRLPAVLPEVPIPREVRPLEVQAGLMTSGTRRLVRSGLDTYTRSVAFYRQVVAAARTLSGQLRQPGEGETVAILVSDRHDNVGMDQVAAAIAEEGGATVLLDAGDDTSTGSAWEAFSLDSLDAAFAGFEHRYTVAGNHDHGDFVSDYLSERGFTHLDGEVVEGPDGVRLLGLDDPRSSGLGTWRDEVGESFAEQTQRVADLACEHDADGERVNTLLVHDANIGRDALARGCVDLVLGGHVHAQLGPTRVEGSNGRIGYTYTNGTTGGAAYAVALGSKLRRDAQVTLVTYRDGRPVGVQPVTVRTVGDFRVGDYLPLSSP